MLTQLGAERIGLRTASVTDGRDGEAVVPYTALLYESNGQTAVYVATGTLTFTRAFVTVDAINGDVVIVKSGVTPGQRVATDGARGAARRPERRRGRDLMRWIVHTSLRFRFVVAGLACVLLYFGVISIGHQKVDAFPEFAPVSVEVQTACLGLSPAEVEQLTTIPLEQSLHGVPGVYDIRSDSEPQLSAIFMYFHSGYDVPARPPARPGAAAGDRAGAAHLVRPAADVPDRVGDQPGDAGRRHRPEHEPHGPVAGSRSTRIRPRLMDVPGVANVAIWGYRDKQIMVEADPATMAEDDVSLDNLMSGGRRRGGQRRAQVHQRRGGRLAGHHHDAGTSSSPCTTSSRSTPRSRWRRCRCSRAGTASSSRSATSPT